MGDNASIAFEARLRPSGQKTEAACAKGGFHRMVTANLPPFHLPLLPLGEAAKPGGLPPGNKQPSGRREAGAFPQTRARHDLRPLRYRRRHRGPGHDHAVARNCSILLPQVTGFHDNANLANGRRATNLVISDCCGQRRTKPCTGRAGAEFAIMSLKRLGYRQGGNTLFMETKIGMDGSALLQ